MRCDEPTFDCLHSVLDDLRVPRVDRSSAAAAPRFRPKNPRAQRLMDEIDAIRAEDHERRMGDYVQTEGETSSSDDKSSHKSTRRTRRWRLDPEHPSCRGPRQRIRPLRT